MIYTLCNSFFLQQVDDIWGYFSSKEVIWSSLETHWVWTKKRPVLIPRLSTAPSESVSYSKISVNVFIGSSLWGPSHQETIRGKADNWTWPKQCGRESIELSLVQSFHNKTLWRSWEPGMILLKIVQNIFTPCTSAVNSHSRPSAQVEKMAGQLHLKHTDILTNLQKNRGLQTFERLWIISVI